MSNIRWTRTGQIKNSRVMEALGWSKEVCAFVEKKHGIKADTWVDVIGALGTIRWSVDYPDMATFDAKMTAVNMDPEYMKFIEKAVKDELFIDGTGVDTLSRRM
jgi:hypothetical protein